MKKRTVGGLGVFSLVVAVFFFFNSVSGITGFVILENVSGQISRALSMFFVAVGIILLLLERAIVEGELERTVSEESLKKIRKFLKQKKFGTYDDLRRLAGEVYDLKEGTSHTVVKLPDGKTLIGRGGHPVTIPRSKSTNKRTYLGILKDLAHPYGELARAS